MNMRQQRITTSQQEVYLIYLMEHTEFAASKIKDGDCCCVFSSSSVSFSVGIKIFLRISVLECAEVSHIFLSQVNRSTMKTGKSSRKCLTTLWGLRRLSKSGKWFEAESLFANFY